MAVEIEAFPEPALAGQSLGGKRIITVTPFSHRILVAALKVAILSGLPEMGFAMNTEALAQLREYMTQLVDLVDLAPMIAERQEFIAGRTCTLCGAPKIVAVTGFGQYCAACCRKIWNIQTIMNQHARP